MKYFEITHGKRIHRVINTTYTKIYNKLYKIENMYTDKQYIKERQITFKSIIEEILIEYYNKIYPGYTYENLQTYADCKYHKLYIADKYYQDNLITIDTRQLYEYVCEKHFLVDTDKEKHNKIIYSLCTSIFNSNIEITSNIPTLLKHYVYRKNKNNKNEYIEQWSTTSSKELDKY